MSSIVVCNSTAARVEVILIENCDIGEEVVADLGGTHHVYGILVRVSEFVRAHPYITGAFHIIATEHTLAVCKLYAERHLCICTDCGQRVYKLAVIEGAREVRCICVQAKRVGSHLRSRRDTHHHVLCGTNQVPHVERTVNGRCAVVPEHSLPTGTIDKFSAKDIVILKAEFRGIVAEFAVSCSIIHGTVIHTIDISALNVNLNIGVVCQRITAALAIYGIYEIEHCLVAVERHDIQTGTKLNRVTSCNSGKIIFAVVVQPGKVKSSPLVYTPLYHYI